MAGLTINQQLIDDPVAVKRAVKDLFQSQFKRRPQAKPLLPGDFVTQRISEGGKNWLIRTFSEEEIKEAVWSCDSKKSPGPDGFNFLFLKTYWDIIKGDLIRVMEEFYANGKVARGCNTSFIVLIPKKEEALAIEDFRPISLIGRVCKIIAEILARRLAQVMDSIISESQSAFVEGRHILD